MLLLSAQRCSALFLVCLLGTCCLSSVSADHQEDDFAEFDEIDRPDRSDSNRIKAAKPISVQSIEDDEFLENDGPSADDLPGLKANVKITSDVDQDDDDDGIQIEDGFDDSSEEATASAKKESKGPAESMPKTLSITNIPFHLRNNWQSYYIEIGLLVLLFGYFVNYIVGMSVNRSIADQFLKGNESLLNSLFVLVGDDGGINNGRYVKESEHQYTLWCTGRNGLECAIFELRLIKRQDFISRMMLLFKPIQDELVVKLFLNEEAMDTYVFCLTNRGAGLKQMRELNDVQTYCTQRKDRMGLASDQLLILSELGDVASQLLDQSTLSFLNEEEASVNYIHISDQFCGPKIVE
jgi:hypothetical protein